MDPDLFEFISRLDDDVPFSPYPQLNDMWADLEDYFDRSYFDIDQFLDELLPDVQQTSLSLASTLENVVPITEPQQGVMTMDELLKSFTIPDTFINDLIPIPALDVDTKVVTSEILLDSIRSHNFTFTGRQYKHPFDKLASHTDVEPIVPPPIDFSLDIETTWNPSISSNLDWCAVLQKQLLYPGITAKAMAKDLLQTESNLPTETEIVNVISLLFNDLNNYIVNLSTKFDDHKFFDADQFDALARKLQEEIFLQFNGETDSLRDVLLKWMGTVTKTILLVNDQRRHVEEIASEKIIDRAVEVYHSRLMSKKPNGDLSLTGKGRDIICEGIRHVYSNCGETFIANVLRKLDERLKGENLTAESATITHANDAGGSDNWTLLIDLLVSEYVSNINQKGLQCAGISTLEQFNDVNATCLKDIWHSFDRKVPVSQQNELKKQLTVRLESESNSKRSEFKRRSAKVSTPSNTDSLVISHLIGIHFGFETLCVSSYDQVNNTFRTIYGPVANVISFTQEGIAVGRIPNDDRCSLDIENILTSCNTDRLYDTKYYGKLTIDSIVALMMMFIDEMVKHNLHTTSRIKYAVAIPSCLGEEMQRIFKTAFIIADISSTLVREQCAITTNFIRENHRTIINNKDEFIVAMIVKGDACDSVVYKLTDERDGSRMIKVLGASGSDPQIRYMGFSKTNGIESELKKITDKCNRINRFLVVTTDQHGTIKQIKNQFWKSKVHAHKMDSNKFADGAAFLSYVAMDGSSNLVYSFDLRPLIKRLTSGVSYRLTHKSVDTEPRDLQELSIRLRSIIDNQLHKLAEIKAATKRLIMGKIKDLEETNLWEDKKDYYRRSLEKDLKTVDDEFSEKLAVEKLGNYWKGNPF